ncbi:MAG: helix-turn-helix domain-containing protein, partial [Polyangiales bacterium]
RSSLLVDSAEERRHHGRMLKPGEFVIVTTRGSRHLRGPELDEKLRALLDDLIERAPKPRDPHIERALEAMTARPEHKWTVAELAKLAGLSRAAFARRFVQAVGAPPLEHLTELRMQIAAARLRETDASLAAVAAAVGYVSEFAFAKAFKRHFGRAPGSFRRTAPTMLRAA